MEYESYKIMQDFEDELVNQGFDDLPLQYAEQNVIPFKNLFSTWVNKFKDGLQNDLKLTFGEDSELEVFDYVFNPIDDHAQGASYIYAKVRGQKALDTFWLRLRYVLFYRRILLFLDYNRTDLDKIKNKSLRKKLSKLNDKHKDGYEHFVELSKL